MAAIINRMGQGFPGDVTRKEPGVIESGLMAETAGYGSCVKLDANGKFAAASAADDAVYGFIVRPYPTQANQANAGAIADCMRSGYITVSLKSGAAKKGGAVYRRIKAASGKSLGDIEAEPAADNTVAIPGCIFMGPADASGNVEISFNI